MRTPTFFKFTQSRHIPLVIEFFFEGEKIEDPVAFFEKNPGIYDLFFPTPEETLEMINQKVLYYETHKLIVSEYGFHMIQL